MKFKKTVNVGLAISLMFAIVFIAGCKKKSIAENASSADSANQINSDLDQANAEDWQFITNTEAKERDDFKVNIRALALKGDFQKLETLAEEFRSKKSQFKSGYWKLRAFYLSFGNLPENVGWL